MKTSPTPWRNDVAPHLPVITRERNFLIANLHANLYSAWRRSRRAGRDWDSIDEDIDNVDDDVRGKETLPNRPTPESLERIWESIAAILTYPDSVPTLPRVPLRSSSRPNDLDAPFRSSPSLSLPELRKAFTLLSTATPTKANLARLLVLAEIIALRSSRNGFQISSTDSTRDGRDFDGELAGGGIGLRPKDWKALFRFTGLSYRHPREPAEIKTLLKLLNQSHQLLGPRLDLQTYNILLHIAAKAKLHSLYEGIEERMKKDGFEVGDLATLGITLNREFQRGGSMQILWARFLNGLRSVLEERSARDEASLAFVFNSMAGMLARTGHLEQAKMLLEGMKQRGARLDLNAISPPLDEDDATASFAPFYFAPPAPTHATYSLLVQSYCHSGNLHAALLLIKEISHRKAFPLTQQHFTSLFKSFANHLPQLSSDVLTPFSLTSNYIPPNQRGNSNFPPSYFNAIPRPRPLPPSSTPYSLATLRTVYNLYISLPLSAPHPKTLFWIILAFEKAGRGRPGLVLGVWRELVGKWGTEKEWRTDTRIRKRVAWWEEEMERRVLEGDELDKGERSKTISFTESGVHRVAEA